MKPLLIRRARVVSPPPHWPCRGDRHHALVDLPSCDVLCLEGRIASITASTPAPPTDLLTDLPEEQIILDAQGRVLMPGFVDCHTHTCFAGNRYDEWRQRLAGEPYLAILARGGGIMSTVRAVRACDETTLADALRPRLAEALRLGTTTIEIKSGYGLLARHELTMLRAIMSISTDTSRPHPSIVPTALLAHAIDPEVRDFVDVTCFETLDVIHSEFPSIAIDAFCETGAWSLADTTALFTRAKQLGHPLRVHTDQFNSLGMIPRAIELGAVSADHLESATRDDLRRLGASGTIGVALPITALHLATPLNIVPRDAPAQTPAAPFPAFANLRTLIDAGGAAALATNFNPGSGPSLSMPMAIALASRYCGLSVEEAITAATINAAAVLGLTDRGCITPDARADLLLLRSNDPRRLGYELGGDPVATVILGGEIVRNDTSLL